jgi:hypothetical protein
MDNTNTSLAVQEDKDLQFVEQGMSLFEQTPTILRDSKTRVEKAIAVSQDFLNRLAEKNYQMDADMDNEAKDLLVKINKTVTLIKSNREPVTQIFTAVAKLFTGLENKLSLKEIDKLPAQIQQARDSYARWCVQEEERKRKEAEEKAAVENEKSELKAWINQKIGEQLANYIAAKKIQWTNSFNSITLEDFGEKVAKLKSVATAFNHAKLAEIIKIAELPRTPRLELPVKMAVQEIATKEYDFHSWIHSHNQQMEELKQKLIDSLPSKQQELEEAAQLERQRIQQEEENRIREEQRQKELLEANAKQKKALEEKQRIEREQEQQRQQQLKAEQEKLAAEKKLREEEEAAKIQQEQEAAKKKAAENAEATKTADVANNLFESTLAIADNIPTPETRQGFNIIVTNPAGYIEMVNLWFQREGMQMSTDELEKMFGKIKSYWEAKMKKDGEKITSKFLKYDIAVKAVNRKDK